MAKRLFYTILCIISLILGGIIYILTRSNTYLSNLFDDYNIISQLRCYLNAIKCGFMKYYLPDYLWGFSLANGLLAIYLPDKKKSLFIISISFLCGLIWETLQFFSILSGTGDLLDIIMYFLASLSAHIIFIIKEKKA